MKKVDILKPCPCGSGINFENCCQPHLLGLEKPTTAEKLLRSRYTAFVAGELDYIYDTHHPEKKEDIDKEAIESWSKESSWHELEILNSEKGQEDDDEGNIEFIAKYTQEGKTYSHRETSIFKKVDDTWYFYDVKKNLPIKKDNKVGRNDPCFCGSGIKFKKCHGKAA